MSDCSTVTAETTEHLTLTSVVFESKSKPKIPFYIFNFNKCCIWITKYSTLSGSCVNLTLTSVVFEWEIIRFFWVVGPNLTLTSVVFESNEASAIDMCVKI